tara:strand:+ start:176 stop:535 length:360 start_codon:yes stop_codon:yes gene_type:complete
MKLKAILFLLFIFSLSCSNDDELFDITIQGSWSKGQGNTLQIDLADSSFYASCDGYCWAMGGKSGTFSVIDDTLITFDYDAISFFKVGPTGGSLKFRKLRSQDPSHDSFLLGTWARVSR